MSNNENMAIIKQLPRRDRLEALAEEANELSQSALKLIRAEKLNHNALHLPLHILATLTDKEKSQYKILGASCHSIEDALKAERLGCTYITAGHIFDTDCKKGLPGRGLDFIKAVCNSV